MKKILITLALAVLGLASAQTVVKLQGFGGNDTAIISSLVREIVNPALEKEGIRAEYQGIEGDYRAALLNALSAGTAADLFYVDIFWSEPLFASGRVEPLNKYFTPQELAVFNRNLLNAFTLRGNI